jgi:hypothetical protein
MPPIRRLGCRRLASPVAARPQRIRAAALVLLLLSLFAPPARADATDSNDADSSLIAPARRDDYGFGSGTGFAILGDGSSVGGALLAGYASSAPFRVELGVQNFAVTMTNDRSLTRGVALAQLGLDTWLFGVGPIAGYAFGDELGMPVFGAGARLGAVDGLSLRASAVAGSRTIERVYSVQYAPAPEKTELVLVMLAARLEAPVARGGRAVVAWFDMMRGPFVRAALGYRARVAGERARGSSTWLEGAIGYGFSDSSAISGCSDCQTFVHGPLFAVTAEQRF